MGVQPREIEIGPTTLETRQARTFHFDEVIHKGPVFAISFVKEPSDEVVNNLWDADIGIRRFLGAIGKEPVLLQNLFFISIAHHTITVIAQLEAWDILQKLFLTLFDLMLPFEETIGQYG
ncbi:MAG: hypothetical protein WDN67_05640 [Candidatus Moraniibacteriota bacterium]